MHADDSTCKGAAAASHAEDFFSRLERAPRVLCQDHHLNLGHTQNRHSTPSSQRRQVTHSARAAQRARPSTTVQTGGKHGRFLLLLASSSRARASSIRYVRSCATSEMCSRPCGVRPERPVSHPGSHARRATETEGRLRTATKWHTSLLSPGRRWPARRWRQSP